MRDTGNESEWAMKKRGFLNGAVSELIATMGHTDRLVVSDAGLPVPPAVRRIDLAVTKNLPLFIDVLRMLLEDLAVERFVLARGTQAASPARHAEILAMLPGAPYDELPHEQFKLLTREARAVIRTGDFVPYSNIILISGVIYP